MQSASFSDLTLHYRWTSTGASKPVIVFINSLGTDLRIWDEVQTRLGGAVSVLVYDKRGHGLSDLGPAPFSMADHVSDLEKLLKHLQIGKAIICGLSVGGQIAIGFTAKHPSRVAGLLLCDTAPKIGTVESWNSRITDVQRTGIASIADAVLERWFTPAFRKADNPAFAIARNMLLRQSPEGYAATCSAIRDTDFSAEAASLNLPALCIVGRDDGATPPELVEDMARRIPNSSFQVIKNCGHIPCLERPDEMAQLILEFMSKHLEGKSHD